MNWDERTEIQDTMVQLVWIAIYRGARRYNLTDWVTTFHPERLACELVHKSTLDDAWGSFNVGCRVRFTNDEQWLVRFPRGGRVKLPNEKVAAEVATMRIIKNQTDIPVPEVKAWGLAAENKLGIGPFIMTSFVEGISLGEIIQNADKDDRLMSDDVSDATTEILYRQVARFVLQLSKLDFARIGSLSADTQEGNDGYAASIHSRPLTLRAHDILQLGGIGVFCSLSPFQMGKAKLSANHEVHYWAHRRRPSRPPDLHHLKSQLNSVDDDEDARRKYVYWNIAKKLIPRLTSPDFNRGPFKLICDVFGPNNMIVNNAKDLKIIPVFDWEWSYAGPEELLWCPPRWLVLENPDVWSREMQDKVTRYNKYFEIYLKMVSEQEAEILGGELALDKRPSTRLLQRHKDGSAWLYHIIRDSFNGPTLMPWDRLRAMVADFDELAAAIPSDEVEAFVQMEMEHLQRYKTLLSAKKEWMQELKAGNEEIPGIHYRPEVKELMEESASD